MRTTPTRAVIFLALTMPALLLACKPKSADLTTIGSAPAPTGRNFTGLWEGKDKDGAAYTLSFTNAVWESHVERDGVRLPYYRGTYTFAGPSNLGLLILEEPDPVTNEWVAVKGNFPDVVTCRLRGGRLKIPALMGTELVRKH